MPNSNNSNSNNDIELESSSLVWDSTIDNLLSKWCDQGKCYSWMHAESFEINNSKARKFMLVINILSALAGVSNIIAGETNINGFQLSWLFGAVSIGVSTLTMLQDKLGYPTRAEIHKRIQSKWAMIINKIEEVVILPYGSRSDCKVFLKMIKSEINHASAENSLISQHIRNRCYEKFKDIPNFDIPDICGQLEHTEIYINNFNSIRKYNIPISITKPLLDTDNSHPPSPAN